MINRFKKLIKRASVAVPVVILVALIAVPVSMQIAGNTQNGEIALRKLRLPQGLRVYSIAQAEEAWPRMTEARIDPLDVHVGNRQTIEVTVSSRQPVAEVKAYIQTDKDTVELPLTLVEGSVTTALSEPDTRFASVGIASDQAFIPRAYADEEITTARYSGTWIVRDTHDTTYQTRIVARADDQESEVVLSWTDACGIPMGGDFTLSGPCTISADDGVDDGNVTIESSLTLDANFAFNDGRSFAIGSGGSIALCQGCSIVKTNIWLTDADRDGFPANFLAVLTNDQPSSMERRNGLSSTVDCDDNVRDYDNNCAEACWPDADGDGFFSVNSTSNCDKSASDTQGDDCYDANVDAFPGQTGYFTTDRGDGSYDYNCNGALDEELSNTMYCQSSWPDCNTGGDGWVGDVPMCGQFDFIGGPSYGNCAPGPPSPGECIMSYSNTNPQQQACN